MASLNILEKIVLESVSALKKERIEAITKGLLNFLLAEKDDKGHYLKYDLSAIQSTIKIDGKSVHTDELQMIAERLVKHGYLTETDDVCKYRKGAAL